MNVDLVLLIIIQVKIVRYKKLYHQFVELGNMQRQIRKQVKYIATLVVVMVVAFVNGAVKCNKISVYYARIVKIGF